MSISLFPYLSFIRTFRISLFNSVLRCYYFVSYLCCFISLLYYFVFAWGPKAQTQHGFFFAGPPLAHFQSRPGPARPSRPTACVQDLFLASPSSEWLVFGFPVWRHSTQLASPLASFHSRSPCKDYPRHTRAPIRRNSARDFVCKQQFAAMPTHKPAHLFPL